MYLGHEVWRKPFLQSDRDRIAGVSVISMDDSPLANGRRADDGTRMQERMLQ